jgi:hypothetical protein
VPDLSVRAMFKAGGCWSAHQYGCQKEAERRNRRPCSCCVEPLILSESSENSDIICEFTWTYVGYTFKCPTRMQARSGNPAPEDYSPSTPQ